MTRGDLHIWTWNLGESFSISSQSMKCSRALKNCLLQCPFIPLKNWDCVLKHFCHLLTEYLKFSLNLFMWLDQLVGVEFLGQWVTNKNLWVGSPRSGMPEQCIQGLTHRRNRWRDYITNLIWKGPYLNCSTSHTELQFIYSQVCVSPSEGCSRMARWLSDFCSLITHYILCVRWLPHKLWSRSDSRENRGPWRKEEEIQQSHWLFTPGWWKSFSIKISRSPPSLLYPRSLTPGTMVSYFHLSESLTGLCESHSSPNILTWITPLHLHYRHPRAQARARGQSGVERGFEF